MARVLSRHYYHEVPGIVQAFLLFGPGPNPLLCSLLPCYGLLGPSLLPFLYHHLSRLSCVLTAQ